MEDHEPNNKDYVYILLRAILWMARLFSTVVYFVIAQERFLRVMAQYDSYSGIYATEQAIAVCGPGLIFLMVFIAAIGLIPLNYAAKKAGKDMTEYVMDKLPEEDLRHCFEKAGDRKYLEKYLREIGRKLGLTLEERFLLYVHYGFFS